LAITWQKIKKRIKLDCRSVTTTSTLRQAAGNFADHGFCTSQNSNRKESITGHAMPALKPNSTEPEIVGVLVALTSFTSNTRPLWRPDNNHFALIDAATLKDFAQTIHPRNKIPSMHLAVTNKEHPCGCHNDASTNSRDHPDVVYISIIQGGEQISCNAQQRNRLMTTSFDALILVGYYRLLKRCMGRWTDVEVLFFFALLGGGQIMHVPGFFTIRNECNMDPTSYSMTVLDSTARLGRDHNLSLPEMHSVQIAYHVLPHTCMFCGVASRMLLEVNTNQIPASYQKGYGFGFLLASVMVALFMRTRESGIRQDYRRFSCYREQLVPARDRWEEMCHETTVYCLHVFAAYGQPSLKKVRTDQYKKIASTISDIWDDTGTLGANHSINQKACLGFCPAWCREAATVESSSPVVKFFNEKYKL
jgi:hypothetical protein